MQDRRSPIAAKTALTPEDKGPLVLIYPFDAEPGIANPTYFSRSVWQIARVTIE